jgi:NADH-quinone oxidoreductase subunit H
MGRCRMILQSLLAVVTAYLTGMLYYGIYRNITARFHKRIGPPVTQNIYDSFKLLFKKESTSYGWIFYMGPIVMATASILTLLFIPLFDDGEMEGVSRYGDLFVVLYLMAMGPLGNALAVGISANPFGAMGIGRGLTRMAGLELPFYLSLMALVYFSGSSDITRIMSAQEDMPNMMRYPLLFTASMISLTGFLGKSPFDVVGAPVEVYSGPASEFGGKFLGLLMSQSAIFTFAKLLLMVDLFWGGAGSLAELLLKSFILFIITVFIGIVYGRFKVHQAVDFLIKIPSAIAVAGILLHL